MHTSLHCGQKDPTGLDVATSDIYTSTMLLSHPSFTLIRYLQNECKLNFQLNLGNDAFWKGLIPLGQVFMDLDEINLIENTNYQHS
jgi:hypothetical protein